MLIALRNLHDLSLASATDTVDMDVEGNTSLLAENRYPNQFLQDFNSSEPEGHALQEDMPASIVAYHVNVSKVDQGRKTMTRQNTTQVDEGVWRSDGPIVSGVRMEGTDRRKPSTPIVEAVGAGVRGFEAGTYGYAIGFSDDRRQPTTTTDIRYFDLLANQRPRIPVPEDVPEGTRFMDVYVTKRGGGPNTLALQAKVNLARLRGKDEYVVRGPWRDKGGPPTVNQTGVGKPHPPRRGKEARVVPSRFDLAAGSYRVFYHIHIPGKGSSLLSVASAQINVRGTRELVKFQQEDGTEVEFMADGPYKKRAGIEVSAPLYVRRTGYRWTAWILHEEPQTSDSGGTTWYRAYPKRNRFGSSTYFSAKHRSITIHGYGSDAEPRGLAAGLTSEEPPTEDTTIVQAPDPTSVPDEAVAEGTETPGPGRYLVSVQGVTEAGELTRDSEPVSVTLGTSQTIRVRLGERINLLPNAEFRRIGADGVPEDWTPTNMGSGTSGFFSVSRGVLTMGTTATTSNFPRMDSPVIPVSRETPLTVAGALTVKRWVAGSARVVLRQMDDAGTTLVDTVVTDLATTGGVPFEVRYGAGGTALQANTTQVRIILRMAGTSANLDMEVRDLQAVGLPTAIRKLQSGSFDTSAAVPVPASSFIAAAPAPTPAGSEVVEKEPPHAVVGFEDGVWPAGWTETGNAGATGEITTNAALHEVYGYRVQDLDQSVEGYRFWDFSLPAESSAALRSLLRVTAAHSVGDVFFNALRTNRSLAFWRLDANRRLWIRYWTGSEYSETLVAALSVGEIVDLEVIVSGVGTLDGQVSVGVGRGEPRSTVVEVGGLNYGGMSLQRASAGVTSSRDNRARFTLDFDQIAVTRKGDILNREVAAAPAGTNPPALDRPERAYTAWAAKTAYATTDERVPRTKNTRYYSPSIAGTSGPNEPAWPTDPRATVTDNAGLAAVARSTAYTAGAGVLAPTPTDREWYECTTAGTTATTAPTYPTTAGSTVTDGTAVFTTRKTVTWAESGSIYRGLDPDGSPIGQIYAFIAPNEGPVRKPLLDGPLSVKPGFSYTCALFARWVSFTESTSRVLVHLEGDGVDRRTFSVLDMPGSRGWHPTANEDDHRTFTVPEGYTRLRYELVLHDGVFIVQESLQSQGAYADFATRDAQRGYGRAASGEITTVLPSLPPHALPGPHNGSRVGEEWAGYGLTTASDATLTEDEVPTIYATPHYATSPDGVLFGPESDTATPDKYLRTRVEFIGDGRDTPVIPSGGIFLRTYSPMGSLLREDGSPFTGGAFVGDRPHPTRYPDIEAESVGGHHVSVVQSEEIGRIFGLVIGAYTEEAVREIEAMSLREPFVIELPLSGGTGRSLTVRFREQVSFETLTPPIVKDGQKTLYAEAELEEAEILEDGPLAGPMVVEGSEVTA